MILELRASELGPRFRQPGGVEFTEFCTRVIRGACSTLDIPQSAIDACSRTGAADGGVDVAVKQGNPGDPTGYFRVLLGLAV